MRAFIMIFVSSVVALAVDYYIYRRVITRHNFGRFWTIGYLVYAFIVDTMVVTALLMYNRATGDEREYMFKAVMWVIAFFFLNAAPKLLYAVISLGDYPVQRFTRKHISHYFGYTGSVLAVILAGVMIYSMTYGRSEIRVTTVELYMDRLPASFDGLRVVQFSDNHLGTTIHRDKFLNRMVDTVNSLRPDIIVNSGDLVNIHERELDESAMSILGRMRARYGVYSVFGNHDLGIYIKDTVNYPAAASISGLESKQRSLGWTVLRDRSVYLSNGTDSIVVSGLDYPADFSHSSHTPFMTGANIGKTYAGVDDSYFNLVVTHAPQLWTEILEAGRGDLTVAGHVHAMQIKLHTPFGTISPARLFYKRWSGLYDEDGRYLYINDGVGYVMFPMRIGTKPEITLFILRSQ